MTKKPSRTKGKIIAVAAGCVLLATGVLAQASKGCYVRIYDDENFKGRTAVLRGPGRDANLKDNKWSGSNAFIGDGTDSIVTGPNAYFEGFEDKNFTGAVVRIGPNKRIADLDTIGDDIESYKLYDKKPTHWK